MLPFLNAIEAALVRNGAQVFAGPALAPTPVSTQPTFVVETSVQRSGNRARVNVRLIDPDPSVPMWVYQAEFSVDSVFGAQDDVAARVADAVSQAQIRPRR
jgi:TolB-like protein